MADLSEVYAQKLIDTASTAGPSPVLFTTPKGTGVHIVATTLPEGWYSTVALLSAPPSESYSVGAADPLNPTLVFDASKASEGESGIGALGRSSSVKCRRNIYGAPRRKLA